MANADEDNPRPTADEETPRSGRRSKGKRGFISVRPPVEPVDQLAVYKKNADALGLDLGDYCVMVLAQAHDLAVPWYITDAIDEARKKREREQRRTGAQPLFDVQGGRPLARSA